MLSYKRMTKFVISPVQHVSGVITTNLGNNSGKTNVIKIGLINAAMPIV